MHVRNINNKTTVLSTGIRGGGPGGGTGQGIPGSSAPPLNIKLGGERTYAPPTNTLLVMHHMLFDFNLVNIRIIRFPYIIHVNGHAGSQVTLIAFVRISSF